MQPQTPRRIRRNTAPNTGLGRKLLIAIAITGAGLFALQVLKPSAIDAGAPPLRPAAVWSTDTTGWIMPMPEKVRALGIAANDIRYLQNGQDVDVYFHELVIEKLPELHEARLIALALSMEPRKGPVQKPQPIEGILSERRPSLKRTNISLRAEGAVECLKTGNCEFWLELTLQEPGGTAFVEHSRRARMPVRPTV